MRPARFLLLLSFLLLLFGCGGGRDEPKVP
jgi:hypothetical protein